MPKITVITHAPESTLGDPALASIFVEQFLKKNPDYKVTLIVAGVNKPGHISAIEGRLIKDSRVETQYYDSVFLDGNNLNEKLYKDSEVVVVYPTINLLLDNERRALEDVNKEVPVLYVTNYNFQQQKEYNQKNKEHEKKTGSVNALPTYEQISSQGRIIETGLGKNLLGINLNDEYVTEKGKAPPSVEDIGRDELNIFQSMFGVPDQNLTNDTIRKYMESTSIYFGYYNNLNNEAEDNRVNAKSFVKLCILDSLKANTNKKVDIILPLSDQGGSVNTNWNSVTKELDLSKVSVEYWSKDPSTNQLVKYHTAGTGPTTVRLINPFPLQHQSMNFMYKISNPITLITGNSSFAEALSYNKIFLYQVMSWHTKLNQDIIGFIKDNFAEEHPYRIFYEMLTGPDIEDREKKLIDYLNENRNPVMEGVKILRERIEKNYSLRDNLPRAVKDWIDKNKRTFNYSGDNFRQNHDDQQDIELKKEIESYISSYSSMYSDFLSGSTPTEKNNLNALLIVALSNRDATNVEKLLREGADVNHAVIINGKNLNPLYFCICNAPSNNTFSVLKNHNLDIERGIESLRESGIQPYRAIRSGVPKHILFENIINYANEKAIPLNKLLNEKEVKEFYYRKDVHFLYVLFKHKLYPSPMLSKPSDYIDDRLQRYVYFREFRHNHLNRDDFLKVYDNNRHIMSLQMIYDYISDFIFKSGLDSSEIKSLLYNGNNEDILYSFLKDAIFEDIRVNTPPFPAEKAIELVGSVLAESELKSYIEKANSDKWYYCLDHGLSDRLKNLLELPQFKEPIYQEQILFDKKLKSLSSYIPKDEFHKPMYSLLYNAKDNSIEISAGSRDSEEEDGDTIFYEIDPESVSTFIADHLNLDKAKVMDNIKFDTKVIGKACLQITREEVSMAVVSDSNNKRKNILFSSHARCSQDALKRSRPIQEDTAEIPHSKTPKV